MVLCIITINERKVKRMVDYTDINARAIDTWVDEGWEWSVPITREAFEEAKNGKWDVLLTPTLMLFSIADEAILKRRRLGAVQPHF